jgi:glutamyl-Q tRNA(Asp) synthetase
LLRIDDIDPPRVVAGAAEQILHSLETYGFEWDGEVSYQSQRLALYQDMLQQLQHQGLVYPCGCSRTSLAAHLDPARPDVYPGICRHGLAPGQTERSLRVRTANSVIQFHDPLQGPQQLVMETECGDFVVKRADGLFAYQLATAVDDALQGISEVVRGADLLESTYRQIHLQQLLSLPSPVYAHLPVACNRNGEKLSKKTLATDIEQLPVIETLYQVLVFLGQNPPPVLRHQASLQELWQWAIQHWQLELIPRCRQIAIED